MISSVTWSGLGLGLGWLALHLSIGAPQVSSTPPLSLIMSSVTWELIGVPRYTMRLLRSSDGMSGGGPTRIPSTMMLPPALDDCIATPPALISHDDSDAVGTLLRLERRAERPRTPASYTRADEPGNKPSRRRRPPRPCMLRAVLFGDRSWEDKKGAQRHNER